LFPSCSALAKSRPSQTTNRVSIGGVQRRCLFISLTDLKQWQEG